MKNNYYGKHYTSVEGLTKDDVKFIFKKMEFMREIVQKKGGSDSLKRKVMTALFYEPSTRTFSSFTAAMERLGGSVIPNRDITSTSVIKGESLKDTIRTLSKLSDVIVLRHSDTGACDSAASVSSVPIINAGDGPYGEHPAHALHDLWTIKNTFNKLAGLQIVMVGDLAHYRNVTSLAKLLALYKSKVIFVAPEQLAITKETKRYLVKNNLDFSEVESLDSVIEKADVLYVTRVKKEYMKKSLYNKIKNKYIIDMSVVKKMKKKSVIMHPLPRINEITQKVDGDDRAIYFRDQLESSLYGKMALLEAILKK